MSRIQRLSPNLINKIAAGEVIERPGSVVKELMENSIDAGATRIDVVIEKGGSDLIRIVDNGCGMDADDLILAVTSHATSKLRSENDLFNVSSMGFRGEAMASVAEIAQMTVRSRVNPGVKPVVGEVSANPSGAEISGMELRVEGGAYHDPTPCGCPPGTQIDVKNLFFNTPVRRKFLKSVQTEFGYISEFFTRLALANPLIHFTLRHNGRVIYDLAATSDWLQRICDVEGKELADALLYVEKSYGNIKIYGYAARPNYSRSNPKMQFLFLNGRPIRDRSLQHALLEAYRGLLTQNRFPICFLKLEMPPEMVDVNVHPTKMEVRFQDSNNIYGQFLSVLRTKFLTTNMATFVQAVQTANDPLVSLTETFRNMDAPETPVSVPSQPVSTPQPISVSQPVSNTQSFSTHQPVSGQQPIPGQQSARQPLPWEIDSAREEAEPVAPFKPFGEDFGCAESRGSSASRFASISRSASDSRSASIPPSDGFGVRARKSAFHEEVETSQESKLGSDFAAEPTIISTSEREASHLARKIIQIHNRYIVTECDEGLMVVDQHAMHERILYERLKKRMKSMSVEVQRLLVPEPVDLRPSETAQLLERREKLEEMGIQIESFGGNTILVHAVPAMLFTFEKKDRLRVDELLREILTVIQNGGGELTLEKFIDDTLHTVACKAACKAGQPLSYEEMRKLLDEYAECPAADHCPHGRPSVLIWSRDELDKMFCRIL